MGFRVHKLCFCFLPPFPFTHMHTITPFLLPLFLDNTADCRTQQTELLLSDDSKERQIKKKKNPDLNLNGWF